MSFDPLVSICIVTFNSARVIEECLYSLQRAQQAADTNCEIYIVDNGSEDDTVDIVKNSFPEVKIILNKKNYGYAKAINQAVLESQGRWLLLINPDVRVPLNLFMFLQRVDPIKKVNVFSPLLIDEKGAIVRTAYSWPTLTKEIARLSGLGALLQLNWLSKRRDLPIKACFTFPEPLGEALLVDYVAGACLFIRQSTWNLVGPFDEDFFLYHEEMEWCWRANQLGINIFVFPRCQVVHLMQKSSQIKPKELLLWRYQGLLHFYNKHRSIYKQVVLTIGLIVSFGIRLMINFLCEKDRSDLYWQIIKVSLSQLKDTC